MARAGSSLAGGRWSLVADLLDSSASDTECAVARTEMLLERYGIVTREAATSEELPGGFTPIYRVLKAMEDTGRVRRGYFVEGLSGGQFGYPGAVDRLRGAKLDDDSTPGEGDVRILAAADPANPYGALLPWPDQGNPEEARPRRIPGAWVVLVAGRLVLYVSPNARSLYTFPTMLRDHDADLSLALSALSELPRGRRRSYRVVERVDGVAARESGLYGLMKECGFEGEHRGMGLPSRSRRH